MTEGRFQRIMASGRIIGSHPHLSILRNQIPIEGAVLDGFGEVGGLNIHLRFEIGNGSGNLEDSCVSSGAQSKLINRHLQ